MKRLILILAFAGLFGTQLYSQVKVGMKLGADFSNLKWKMDMAGSTADTSYDRLTSPRLGFLVDIPVNDFLFVQSGFNFGIKGTKYEGLHEIGDEYVDTEDTQVILFLEIPATFGYKYDLDGAKLFVMAGPVLSYNLYATELYKYKGETDNIHQSIGNELEDSFRPMDLSGRIEGGIEVNRFLFSVAYTSGFSNLYPNIDGLEESGFKCKSNIITLAAGIKFGDVDGGGRGGFRRH